MRYNSRDIASKKWEAYDVKIKKVSFVGNFENHLPLVMDKTNSETVICIRGMSIMLLSSVG